MRKSIIILLIAWSFIASSGGIFCGRDEACNGGIQKLGDGVQQSGTALNTQ